jgi:methylated-DNA-[protein]-cysteine S-methyltransferase
MIMYYDYFMTPVGELVLGMTSEGLSHVLFENGRAPIYIDELWKREPSAFRDVRAQLEAYFAGKLRTFDIKLAALGTDFQKAVWRELLTIGYGETTTYTEIARRISYTKGARAVGTANGQNPLAIIVPCHRVIGLNGSLTGYGGGLRHKRFLLELEQGMHTAVPKKKVSSRRGRGSAALPAA